ncbi:protein kinase domain-containing protein [Rhabdochlamydiaceae symbiont of Dictyostelium giganteum]|uniref:protein kinase domain-containing protein n=1 Tax=Rhabdochlamydiaceae symbiont of Dictyostelium giganteum TaxID=3342349 RepID=UPI00384F42C7
MEEERFYKQPTLVEYKFTKIPLSIPSQIGPYKIDSFLSKGGMSLLYLGTHPETKAVIAIKVLSLEYVKSPEIINQFLHEAKMIGLTNHPNIVKLYGEGKWEGGVYIAMEFIRGISLRQFITQHSLSMKKSLDIFMQTAHALAHFHAHGVIHGDLKPENILITETGEVKVIDFGIAKLQEEIQKEGKQSYRMGTPTYMSPEQKENPLSMSFASDIYALGIIGYELFMGKLSFGVIHLSQIPGGLRPILEKALAISLKGRYATVLELLSDVSYYLKSGGLEKDKPSLDQVKEIQESLQHANLLLSPRLLTPTSCYEGAIAKLTVLGQTTPYFDVIRLSNDTHAFILAEPKVAGLETAVYLSSLRGSIRALLLTSEKFELSSFLFELQKLIQSDFLHQHYAFSFLLLDSLQDELKLVCCDEFATLMHLTRGRNSLCKLSNKNGPLGAYHQNEWHITRVKWEVGDTLLFHTFPSSLDSLVQNTLQNLSYHAPQSQVDHFMKKITPSLGEKKPHVAISIHRIG